MLTTKKYIDSGAILFASVILFFTSNVQAAIYSQGLDFTATDQSIWGPSGSTIGFDYSNSIGIDLPFSLGSVSVGYSVGASSGAVSVGYDGDMTVDYTETLSAPGTATLNLGYLGQTSSVVVGTCTVLGVSFPCPSVTPGGGDYSTTLGAHAQLTSSVGNVGPDFTLATGKSFTPELGTSVSDSDSLVVAQVPVINVVAAEAGVQMGVTQNTSFVANGIDGILNYSLQGSTDVFSTGFSIGSAGLSLDVDLMQAGIWDFWFEDQTLNNAFATDFDLDLGVYASTVAGCGFAFLESCETSYNVLSLDVFDVDPFGLNFNSISNTDGFSIVVNEAPAAVPEPSSLMLMGFGLLGLGFVRKHKAV